MEAQEARLWASSALLQKPVKGSEPQGDGGSSEVTTATTTTNTADDSYIAPATVVTLGLSTEYNTNASNDLSARLVIPFANGRQGSLDTMNQVDGSEQMVSVYCDFDFPRWISRFG